MTQRVAVLSDIHGVLPALDAVLAEPDVVAADLIVVTGDTASGPQPRQVIERLADLGERLAWIRGNADRELVTSSRGGDPGPDPITPWAAAQLREDQLRLLASLPTTLVLPITGLSQVMFCHATPRDDEEVVLVDSRPDRWREVFDGLDPAVETVVCGHTHMPFARLAHGRLVVNPGSVGMPYGRAGAHWALLGPGVELRRSVFDLDAAVAAVTRDSSYADVAEWADYFIRARGTDVEALAAFGPRDGRTTIA